MERRLFVLAGGMFAIGTDSFVVAGVLDQVAASFGVSVGLAGQMGHAVRVELRAAVADHRGDCGALAAQAIGPHGACSVRRRKRHNSRGAEHRSGTIALGGGRNCR